jgi:hypothetical protein
LRAFLVLGLEHKAHARVIALVLDARESPALALEAHAAGLAHAHPVEGTVGTTGQRLGQHGIQVLGQPGDPQHFRQLMKGVLGKTVLLPQGRKGCAPILLLSAGDGADLPAWAGSARIRRRRLCPAESTAL